MHIACISKITWLSAILWGRGRGGMGEPPCMNAEGVCLSVRYGFFLPAEVSLYTAKKSKGFTLLRNETCGKSTNLLQSIRANRKFLIQLRNVLPEPPIRTLRIGHSSKGCTILTINYGSLFLLCSRRLL